jgi:hypothetical protein
MPRFLSPLAALLAVLAGCGLTDPPARDRLTLHVAPHTAECVGAAQGRCLLVREEPRAEWSLFHDPIAGFSHEPGFAYTLRVERRRVPDPPADGSAYEYRLLRILARDAAPTP